MHTLRLHARYVRENCYRVRVIIERIHTVHFQLRGLSNGIIFIEICDKMPFINTIFGFNLHVNEGKTRVCHKK